MKTNTSRENRLAFNNFPERYDRGRPTFDRALVKNLLQRMEVIEDEPLLEIGPATGQLTVTLLACGLRVVAVEPGPQLAAYLQAKSWADHRLQVICSTFEDFNSDESFAVIVAANSFHWIDPAVGYQKAYDLLRPNGALCLLWTFPILADADLQQLLNDEVFINDLRDFHRQSDQHVVLIRELMAEGRAELVANSRFDKAVEDDLFTVKLSWSTEQYIAFQRS
jgi:SAM-dependent methyltransferase